MKILFFILLGLTICPKAHAEEFILQERSLANSSISVLIFEFDKASKPFANTTESSVTYWDIDKDGIAELTSWIGQRQALLMIDKSLDGKVKDHVEAIRGDGTNGFSILSKYDLNRDSKITPQDAVWRSLVLWFDKDTDGQVIEREIKTLDDMGIKEISLDISTFPEPLSFEQRISHFSEFEMLENEELQNLKIYNVLPIFDETNTAYRQNYKLNIATLFMPTLRHSGLSSLLFCMKFIQSFRSNQLLSFQYSVSEF